MAAWLTLRMLLGVSLLVETSLELQASMSSLLKRMDEALISEGCAPELEDANESVRVCIV